MTEHELGALLMLALLYAALAWAIVGDSWCFRHGQRKTVFHATPSGKGYHLCPLCQWDRDMDARLAEKRAKGEA